MKLLSLLLLSLLVARTSAQTVTLRTVPVHFERVDLPHGIEFLCAEGYGRDTCAADVKLLLGLLRVYPIADLGHWSFVLVSERQWQPLLNGLRHDPEFEAFSLLDQRVTVFESRLFQTNPQEAERTLEKYGVLGDAMLRLAVTHELGHALCLEKDERKAEENRRRLMEGRKLECGPTRLRASGH